MIPPQPPALDFAEISRRLHALSLPPCDAILGIRSGGTVPAALLAHQLHLPLRYLSLNFRDPANQPRYPQPQLLSPLPDLDPAWHTLLLVDDVAVSGQTLATARSLFPHLHLPALVLKGRADFVLFPEIPSCVRWPWSP